MDFEIALRMCADGAGLRRIGADDDMTAVAAFPDLDLALFKDRCRFDILQQRAVTLLVMTLDCRDHAELLCENLEAFFLRFLCKGFVHIGPFVVFALSRVEQVLCGIADAGKLLEPHLCVFLFVLRRL